MTKSYAFLLCCLVCPLLLNAQPNDPHPDPAALQTSAPQARSLEEAAPSAIQIALADPSPLGAGAAPVQNTSTGTPPVASSSKSPVGFAIYDRARLDTWQWFASPPQSETYAYLQNLLRIAVTQKSQHWDWELELAQPSIFHLPKDAVSSAPQGQLGLGGTYYGSDGGDADPAAAFLKQGFLRYHFTGADRSFRVGRIEFNEGLETAPKDKTVAWLQANRIAARLIGNFGFSNAQRSLDGVDLRYNFGDYHLIVLAARADQGVFNMNGNPEINADIQYGALTHPFASGHGLWRAFAIGYHDGRTGLTKTDNRPAPVRALDHKNIRLGTYGADLIWTTPLAGGTADFVAWGAFQNGQWGVQSQSADAGAVEGGYQFKLPYRPWLRAGEYRSSGDGNPADNEHNTFVQLLPTPRVYARDPFFNSMNLNDQFVSAVLRPSPKVAIRSDLHWLQLSNGHDFWYLGGGAFDNKVFGFTGRPSGGHTSFASLYDISADCAVAKTLDLNFYYAHVWGKSVIASVYPADRNSNFGYVELLYHWGLQQRAK